MVNDMVLVDSWDMLQGVNESKTVLSTIEKRNRENDFTFKHRVDMFFILEMALRRVKERGI